MSTGVTTRLPKRRSVIYRAFRWPLRTVIKGLIVSGRGIAAHKAVSFLTLLVLLLIGVGSYAGYEFYTTGSWLGFGGSPAPTSLTGKDTGPTNSPAPPNGPAQPQLPILVATQITPPESVSTFLHSEAAYDSAGMWNALSQDGQNNFARSGISLKSLRDVLARRKQSQIQYQQIVYVGGYQLGNGTSMYYFVVTLSTPQGGRQTSYSFQVDQTGKIASVS